MCITVLIFVKNIFLQFHIAVKNHNICMFFGHYNIICPRPLLHPRRSLMAPFSSGSVCPSPVPPSPGEPCSRPGALDCPYENQIDNNGVTGHCCCGQCDVDMTCAPDSNTGSGLWQPLHSSLCPAEGCGSEGEWWKIILSSS